MSKMTYAITQKKLELRSKALAANSGDIPHLEIPRTQIDAMATELKDLSAQQASLAAAKQEASKRLADLVRGARKMLTFVDIVVKQHYGNQAEKLVEFGVQPFRSAPRVRLVGPDGKPVKKPIQPQPQASSANP
jgi:Asp-tRNA(Asn)/Glu-tRNA(Gln) amidotransferase B subunit